MRTTSMPNRDATARWVEGGCVRKNAKFAASGGGASGRRQATVSKIKIPSYNFEVLISIRVLENFRPEIPSASAPIRLCTVRATRIEKSKMQIEKPAAPKRGVGKI